MRIMDGPHERASKPTYHIHVELDHSEVVNIQDFLNYVENRGIQYAFPTSVRNVLNQLTKDIDLEAKSEIKVQHFFNTSGLALCGADVELEMTNDDSPICRKCFDSPARKSL